MLYIESTREAPPAEIGWIGNDIKTARGVTINSLKKSIPVPIVLNRQSLPTWLEQSPTMLEDFVRVGGRSLLLQSKISFNEVDTLANIQQAVLTNTGLLYEPNPRIEATAFIDNHAERDYRIGPNIDLFRMHTDHQKFWITGDHLKELVHSRAIYPHPEAIEGRDFFYVWEGNNIVGISVKLNAENLWTVSSHRGKPTRIPQSGTNFREKTLAKLHIPVPKELREPDVQSVFVYQTEHPLKIGKIGKAEDFDLIIAPHLTRDPYGQDHQVYTNMHLPARALDGVMVKNNRRVLRSNWHIRVEVSGYAHPDQIGQFMILTAQRRGQPDNS